MACSEIFKCRSINIYFLPNLCRLVRKSILVMKDNWNVRVVGSKVLFESVSSAQNEVEMIPLIRKMNPCHRLPTKFFLYKNIGGDDSLQSNSRSHLPFVDAG